MQNGLFSGSARCLSICDPVEKCAAVHRLQSDLRSGALAYDDEFPAPDVSQPGRPQRPQLVNPARVTRRRLGSAAGRTALVHAIAHIEFNAINLALDAACRFRGMPQAYYSDWISVAADEARHFTLLMNRLLDLGSEYGALTAHDGLWEMAERTADSCLVRMALVPRVLEARGLDVTPGMIGRLRQAGDTETVAILETILEEEVGHVAIGSRWFEYCCEIEGLEPAETFLYLLESRYSGTVRGPLNLDARLAAGFSRRELEALDTTSQLAP